MGAAVPDGIASHRKRQARDSFIQHSGPDSGGTMEPLYSGANSGKCEREYNPATPQEIT